MRLKNKEMQMKQFSQKCLLLSSLLFLSAEKCPDFKKKEKLPSLGTSSGVQLRKKEQILNQEGIVFEPGKAEERFKAWADLLTFSDKPSNALQVVQEWRALRESFLLFLDSLRIKDRKKALVFDRKPFTDQERLQGHFSETQKRLKALQEELSPGIPQEFIKGFYAYLADPQSVSEDTRKEMNLPPEIQSPKAYFETLTTKLQKALVLQRKQTASRDWLSLCYVYRIGVEKDDLVAQTHMKLVKPDFSVLEQRRQWPSLSEWKQRQIALQNRWEVLMFDRKTEFLAQTLKEDQELPQADKEQEQLLRNPFIDPWALLGELIVLKEFEEAQTLWERIPRKKEGAVEEKRKELWNELKRGKAEGLEVDEIREGVRSLGEKLLQEEGSTFEDQRFVTLLMARVQDFQTAIHLGEPLLKDLRHTLEDQRLIAPCYVFIQENPKNLQKAWELYSSIVEHPDSNLEDLTQAVAVGYLYGREEEARALWDQVLKQKDYTKTEQAQVAQALEQAGLLQAAAEAQSRIENWAQMGALLERCAERNQGEKKNRFLVQAAQAYEKQAGKETDPLRKAEVFLQAARQAQGAQKFKSSEGFYHQALRSLDAAPERTEQLQVKRAQCCRALGFLYSARRKVLFEEQNLGKKGLRGWTWKKLQGEKRKPFLSLEDLKQSFPPEEEDFLSQARAQFLLLRRDYEYKRLLSYGITDQEEDFFLKNDHFFLPQDRKACLLFLRTRKEKIAEILQKAGSGSRGNSDWLIQAALRWVELENWSKVDEISSLPVQEKSGLWKQEWPEICQKAGEAYDQKKRHWTARSYWNKAEQGYQALERQGAAAYAHYRALYSELNDQRKVYQDLPQLKLNYMVPGSALMRFNTSDPFEEISRRKQCSSRIQALEKEISVSESKLQKLGVIK